MIAGWRQSLFGRLLVSQLLLTLIVAIALPAVILTTLRRTADDQLERQLRRDADVIQAILARGPPPDPAAAATVLGPLYARQLGSRAYRVTAADGRVLAQGGAPAALPPPPRQPGGGRRLRAIGKLDVYRRTVAGAGGPVVITIAQDRTRPEAIVDDVVAAFVRRTVWLIPLILAVSTLVGLVTVRRVSHAIHLT